MVTRISMRDNVSVTGFWNHFMKPRGPIGEWVTSLKYPMALSLLKYGVMCHVSYDLSSLTTAWSLCVQWLTVVS